MIDFYFNVNSVAWIDLFISIVLKPSKCKRRPCLLLVFYAVTLLAIFGLCVVHARAPTACTRCWYCCCCCWHALRMQACGYNS